MGDLVGTRRATVWPSRAAVTALVAVAAVLGAIQLGNASIWLDEAVSANLARIPLNKFASVAAAKEANMLLYYLILRPWMWIGHSEAVLRLPSVLAAAATVPVVYAIGVRLRDRTAGLLSALLFAVNGFVVHYAHEARGYTLAAFSAAAAALLLLRAREQPSRGRWAAWGCAAGLGLYVHLFVGFVVVAQVLCLVFLDRRRRIRGYFVAAFGTLVVVAAPLGTLMFGQRGAGITWVPAATLRTVGPTFQALAGFGGRDLLIAYSVACVLGLVAVARSARARFEGILVASMIVIPIVIAFGVSLSVPIVRPQYLIVVVPAMALLAGPGLASLRNPLRVLAGAAIFVFLAIEPLPAIYTNIETHDWRSAAGYVLQHGGPDDGIVFYAYYGWTPFWFYMDGHEASAPESIYPPVPWHPPVSIRQPPLERSVEQILDRRRVRLVLNNTRTDRPTQEFQDLLDSFAAAQYKITRYAEFHGGIRLRLYER